MIVYSKNKCQKCRATKLQLTKYGVEYEEHNIDEEPEAREVVEALAKEKGYLSMPIVVLDDGASWSDFQLEKIKEVAGK